MYATTNYTKENITIRNFGINEEGNPSLEVQGQAGKFIPDGDEDFFACVFYTDKGIFAVTVAAGEDENVRYFKIANR